MAVAGCGLIVLSPVMAVIAVAVRRDSPGPALFRQERIGMGGRPFTMLKFRTMAATSTPSTAKDSSRDPNVLVTAAGDPRVTRVGARLRSSKLDELPQLVNVVRGEMALVGPRPEVARYVALWAEADRQAILSVRPGITDPAAIHLRREEELLAAQDDPERYYRTTLLPQKVAMYRDYVESRTFLGDLRILLQTVASVAFG